MLPERILTDENMRKIANWYCKTYFYRLWRQLDQYGDDIKQVVEIAILEAPENVSFNVWTSILQAGFRKLASEIGLKEGRIDNHHVIREIPVAMLMRDGEDADSFEERIETILIDQPWTYNEKWLNEAYSWVKETFDAHFTEREWRIFLSWLHGWSREEIQIGFEIYEDLTPILNEMIVRLRNHLGIETDVEVPMPYENPNLRNEFPDDLRTFLGVGYRYYLPAGLTNEQVQKLFWVSRSTAWRALKNGYLYPGLQIPRKDARWNDLLPDETVMELDSTRGRWDAKRHILARDGWRFEMGAMWCQCSICGKWMLISDTTIDHYIPKDKGGGNNLGNLKVAHRMCNFAKGNKLPFEDE